MDTNMSDKFECRAPQLYEELPLRAQLALEEDLDEFFDVMQTPEKAERTPEEFFTPLVGQSAQTPGKPSQTSSLGGVKDLSVIAEEESEPVQTVVPVNDEPKPRVILAARRRSGPASNSHVRDEVDHLARRMFEGITLDAAPSPKHHPMVTRLDVAKHTPKLTLRNRQILKRKTVNDSSPPEKYICLAEKIHHFFKDTPPRFKGSSQNQPNQSGTKKNLFSNVKLTVPISPHLITKERCRSPSPTPVADESFKPEVHPYNPKIFTAPDAIARPAPKPPTVPQPFNIKGVVKKDGPPPKEETFAFKANPVPPSCRSSTSSSTSSSSAPRASSAAGASGSVRISNRMISLRRATEKLSSVDEKVPPTIESHKGVYHSGNNGKFTVKRTKSAERDKIVHQHKDDQQDEFFVFKAQPVPASCYNPRFSVSSRTSTSSKRSSTVSLERRVRYPSSKPETDVKKHVCGPSSDHYTFKAKPPTVLFKSPFKVKKANIPLTEVTDFVLNTERRAKEREEYDRRIEEQRMAEEMARKQADAARAISEKEDLIRLRQSLVPKAQPLPHFISKTPKKK
ncbi:Hypothetical protein NTJ_02271 [Nesidiocoris tenuis]|uniref:TPX2 C-terminal domain-containing protein n=1 Tax=Nesidiocoris tenuis TaxID=355587 RepID=A0ABN7ADN2_9HEMI|nr:Hypothetical protein NTJ_02271 [Nesidiocoris tenuis]